MTDIAADTDMLDALNARAEERPAARGSGAPEQTSRSEDSNAPQQASVPADPRIRSQIIRRWLESNYLNHSFQGLSLSISLEDFLRIPSTASLNPDHSWLTDDQVELPLVLLATSEKFRNIDTLVLPLRVSQELCAIGVGTVSIEERSTDHHDVYETMTKEDHPRWIIALCGDGMLAQFEREEETTKTTWNYESGKGEENQSIQQENPPVLRKSSPGVGSHWGIMIIDTERQDARWLDGNISLAKKTSDDKRYYYIKQMHRAGEAAGKILQGYDLVMGHEARHFQTGTLKHLPNDNTHNRCQGDKGSACGPYAYAIVKYLFQNRTYLEDLKGGFSIRNKREHVQRMDFHSLQTRREMQRLIHEEAERKRGSNEWPYKLTDQILRILNRPEPQDILNWLHTFRPTHSPGQSFRDSPPPPPSPSLALSASRNDPDLKKPSDDLVIKLNQIIKDDPSNFAHLRHDPTRQLQAAYEVLQVQQLIDMSIQEALKNKARDDSGGNTGGTAGGPSTEPSGGGSRRDPPPGALEDNSGKDSSPRPSDATEEAEETFNIIAALQNHYVNFVLLPNNQLQHFVDLGNLGEALTDKTPEWSQRAILTKVYGDFDRLSEADTRKWKASDPLFESNPDASHKQVIETLKKSVCHVAKGHLRGVFSNYPSIYVDAFIAKQMGDLKTGKHVLRDGSIQVEGESMEVVRPDVSAQPPASASPGNKASAEGPTTEKRTEKQVGFASHDSIILGGSGGLSGEESNGSNGKQNQDDDDNGEDNPLYPSTFTHPVNRTAKKRKASATLGGPPEKKSREEGDLNDEESILSASLGEEEMESN